VVEIVAIVTLAEKASELAIPRVDVDDTMANAVYKKDIESAECF
jgi:hypothetical protein